MKKKGVEDVRELIHHIQSRLPVKDAARTSVLSKSWLHAWSTIPTLRFIHRPTLKEIERKHMKKGRKRKIEDLKLVDIDCTLTRYISDKIPIESFDLVIDIESQESASLVENWFRRLATETCVKELSLTIFLHGASFNLPYEILSSENLTKLQVNSSRGIHSCLMTNSHDNPVIVNCVSLQELHFDGVRISQEILDGILSSCSMLAKIDFLLCSRYLNVIKVKNLPCLYELRIYTDDEGTSDLEISHLPNLRVFICEMYSWRFGPLRMLGARPFKDPLISLGSSVTELSLGCRLITGDASLDMIKSGFPLLETLTLGMKYWKSRSFHFICASPIKRLSLLSCSRNLVQVQVHAPKLVFFRFDGGDTLPSLLFPISTLEEISLGLKINLDMSVDASFFVMIREALTISQKCDLHIMATLNSKMDLPFDINISDLQARLPFPPAKNVQQLSFQTRGDECLWERSSFFDAFFEICHPKHVFAEADTRFRHNNHFCRLMLREVLVLVLDKKKTKTGWPCYLKHVQTRQDPHQKWKTLTHFHTRFLDGSAPSVSMHFNLNWL